ncbi:MAG: PEGA domain-containing protein [Polyangiaceae bacterium]
MTSRTLLALLLGGIVLTTLAAPVYADTPTPAWKEADEHFRQGVQLFKENNFTAALVEFKRAYEIDPKYQVLYNIGESHYQLQDYANALKTFEKYLAEGGTKIPAKRRKEVEKEMVTLKGRVATITITTSEPGATITIDDVSMGKTPLEPVLVSAGRRKITATLEGRVPVTQVVDLAGGDQQTIDLAIPAAPKPIEQEKPLPPAPSVAPTVICWSVTGALAIGAVITGVLALGASSDLETELTKYPADADAIESAHDKAFALGLATDILIGTSVAVAAVSVYFTVDFAAASDASSSKPPAPSARITVVPGGVVVGGTF